MLFTIVVRAPASPVLWPFRTVWLVCPGSEIGVLGWRMHWLVRFFALSVVFALNPHKHFGVVI